jgi:LAO/AO transport system kinase
MAEGEAANGAGGDRLAALRAGGKPALARALAAIEAAEAAPAQIELLDAAFAAPRGHVVGMTGPPGVGKSTLAAALIDELRARGETVGVIAVDPSSKRRGGALLGDRTRILHDPEDAGLYVRSMAAREELGGLAALTMPALVLMRALFDRVLVETVGVGQSETTIGEVADTVVFAAQPASGDSLQFMKAGIVEVPHIAVVTKADMGGPAERAARELEAALAMAEPEEDDWEIKVRLVAAAERRGIAELLDDLDRHRALLGEGLAARRRAQAGAWVERRLHDLYGRRGLAELRAEGEELAAPTNRPFGAYAELSARLEAKVRSSQSGTRGATTAASA